MKYIGIIKRHGRVIGLSLAALLVATLALFGWRSESRPSDLTTTAQAQSIVFEQRLNQIEQRFNYIESRLNRLESESRYPGTATSSARNDTQLTILRAQMDTLRADIDSLRGRTGELECAVLKLDERTLTPAARATRRTGGSSEPCRANSGTPVRLSARP
ncbi:MAG TPA: hypothetical protein VEV84_09440 [Pyrinomonadaceae bacterium]|jgi:hypothetical protein|nr:hypothetical protein [Pyrinomonadaceae bacterium]